MSPGHLPPVVLLDAGGTLVLQDPVEMGERLGVVLDPQTAHLAHYQAMAEYSELRFGGVVADWDWWLERYFTILDVPEPGTAGERIDRGFGLWHHPLDGVEGAVRAMRDSGVRVAVVSNSDGSVRASLDRAGLLGLFEFVVDSHEVGVSKPDPAIFQAALDRMGVVGSDAWYIGDSLFHDVEGARAAGLARAVLVDPYRLGPAGVDRVSSVADL